MDTEQTIILILVSLYCVLLLSYSVPQVPLLNSPLFLITDQSLILLLIASKIKKKRKRYCNPIVPVAGKERLTCPSAAYLALSAGLSAP